MTGARIKIAANIMDADLTRIGRQVAELQDAGADLLHMDIMDGHYVPAFVGGPRVLKAIKNVASVPVDVHLMVSNPDEAVNWFIDAGADIVIFHAEASEDASGLIKRIQNYGVKAGIALNPTMEARNLRGLTAAPDSLLAMTVEPGSSGQSFMEKGCEKIPELRSLFGEEIDVYVDGGLNTDTLPVAAGYGANVFAMASAIFRSGRPFSETIPKLREAAKKRLEKY